MTRRTLISLAIGTSLIAGLVAIAASFPLKLLNALTSRKGYTIESGVAYGALPRHKLDIYTPDNATRQTPVVVFFYGGGWNRGERANYLFVGQSLASAGYIVVVPDYRLYPDVVFPDFVADAAEAVAFMFEKLGGQDGQANPLFLAGHSAGAHIAALLNLDARYLAATSAPQDAIAGVAGLSGPYDFLPLTEEIYKKTFPEAVRAESQPIEFVDGHEAPMLLIVGGADRTVDPGNTARLAAAIEAHGREATVVTYPSTGHIGTVAALASAIPWPKPAVREAVIEFVEARAGEIGMR